MHRFSCLIALLLENYAALLRKMQRNAEAEKMEARAKAIRAKKSTLSSQVSQVEINF